MKCYRCEKEFTPNGARNTKYCSKECGDQNSVAVCYCKTCNARFETSHVRKYCTKNCNPQFKTLNLSNRICIKCNHSYKPRYKAQKYCSSVCSQYKPHNNGKDYFYTSRAWRQIRAQFIASYTLVNGIQISNKYCIECYRKKNRLNDMYAVDHIIRRVDGGNEEHNNLQSLCKHHHQSKSASEGNRDRFFIKDKFP